MRKIAAIGLGVAALVLAAGAAYLWTPPAPPFDAAQARRAAADYDARIVRDRWGVPHIFGARDADVAFGLAYAHAEDDWKTFEEVLLFTRGKLALRTGKNGAVTDYLTAAMGANEAIKAKYETDLSIETRRLIEGYAAGLNFYCAERKERCAPGAAPISAADIVAGFAARTPFFYGLEESLKAMFEDDAAATASIDQQRQAYLHLPAGIELGSNAMAVAPKRSADGATRLMVNSHQPFTGPVAWYEARVKSDEGWDMIGGVFPGSPIILHGASANLGWAFTVNKPDLVDVYALKTDRKKNPRRYWHDGAWKAFERGRARFRVRLAGPFSLPVSRATYRTVHGPAFETPGGWRAVAFAGDREIRAIEQWRRMNMAQNFEDWRAAMAMRAIPSFNVVYADKTGKIAYVYNMAAPKRAADWDWSKTAPGDRADLVWDGVLPFEALPNVIDPKSGYVVNANNEPWSASAAPDSPQAEQFPDHVGVRARSTNRGLREQELYGADLSITGEEFVAYKMDDAYAENSALRRLIAATLVDPEATSDLGLAPALEILRRWDGRANLENRGAALAITFGRYALGTLMPSDDAKFEDPIAALHQASDDLAKGFGRLDPEWSAVNRLKRGDIDLPIAGGPDTLRAIYSLDDVAKGSTTAVAGDTYVMVVEWRADGGQTIRTIHQFGSATLDSSSKHYADQAPFFADERFKLPPMTLEAALVQATRDYRPGRP